MRPSKSVPETADNTPVGEASAPQRLTGAVAGEANAAETSNRRPEVMADTQFTDGRPLWEWRSKWDSAEAREHIRFEAVILCAYLAGFLLLAGAALSIGGLMHEFTWTGITLTIDFRLVAIFFVGCLGGTVFSLKWLVHSSAKGKWHLDRRYWRFLTPWIGGVYACVILTMFDSGVVPSVPGQGNRDLSGSAALAFLLGYFADGVSGLLSNIANAIFGTLERK